uniref:DUF1996 domain-containing protein n=1 Tax=Mycena chlorophos TaxID=658473 RepID=A0ABQ0LN39_MYCCL|nr:predicted protein [Mycena chlorophos]
MVGSVLSKLLLAATALSGTNAYFLFSMSNILATERLDPIVSPGKVSGHTHTIIGGSNFRATTNTSFMRESLCTTSPIKEDKSNYWAPTLYFQWKNGSFSSVTGNPLYANVPHVLLALKLSLCRADYLFSDTPGVTTPFPDNFRMLSGDPTLRTYNSSSFAQQAITFLCLNFDGTSTKFNQFPQQSCPSGVRAQINFPSCWNGVDADSADHKSHVAFLSTGPDSGTCTDPAFPKTLPRVFMEMYLDTVTWDAFRSEAMNPTQPYVYAMGDPTGYGYHADFIMGWESGVLENVFNSCSCTSAAFGDPTCCGTQGVFTYETGGSCLITKEVDETVTGTLLKLPGNNPVLQAGQTAPAVQDVVTPPFIEPVFAYTGTSPSQTGNVVGSASTSVVASGSTATGGASTSSSGSSSSGSSSSGSSGSSPGSGSGSSDSSPASDKSGSSSSSSNATGSGPGSGSESVAPPACAVSRHGRRRRSVPAKDALEAHHARHRRFATPQARFMDHEY